MNRGLLTPASRNLMATLHISSSEGVISPLRPMKSTSCSIAVLTIFSAGVITPRSITSKLLQESTTAAMFLPMSCTSPLTVAMRYLPFDDSLVNIPEGSPTESPLETPAEEETAPAEEAPPAVEAMSAEKSTPAEEATPTAGATPAAEVPK